MDITTLLGLVIGFGAILAAVTIEGGELQSLLNVPGALIIFVGTFGATMVSYPLHLVKKLPQLIMLAFKGKAETPEELIEFFVDLASQARREGLLSLEERARSIDDPFLRKGIMLVVDGVDPKMVKEILQAEKESMAHRHREGYGMLEAMGGYAPTLGVLGAVLGLIHALSSLEDPSGLGEAIAVAFVATLYGVGVANLIWLPLASKLKTRSEAELFVRDVMMEGILAIQAGHSPQIVREYIAAFVAPKLREQGEAAGQPAGQMQPEAA